VVLKTLKSTPGFVLGRCLTPVRAKCTYSFGEFPLVLPSAVNVKKIFVLFTFCCSRLYTVVLLLLFNTSTLFSS